MWDKKRLGGGRPNPNWGLDRAGIGYKPARKKPHRVRSRVLTLYHYVKFWKTYLFKSSKSVTHLYQVQRWNILIFWAKSNRPNLLIVDNFVNFCPILMKQRPLDSVFLSEQSYYNFCLRVNGASFSVYFSKICQFLFVL